MLSGEKTRRLPVIWAAIGFCLIVLLIVVTMALKNARDMTTILEDSIRSQLFSISVAARNTIDTESFLRYNSMEDVEADQANYNATLKALRLLAADLGAEYIYALKYIDGEYQFVFDTDQINETVFVPYELSAVHLLAFAGRESADVMNVEDEYGSFNTAAVPIWHEGVVVGIICTDIVDHFLAENRRASTLNAVTLSATLLITMLLMMIVLIRLLRRVRAMQDKLHAMAHYDTITGLPNRQHLLEHMEAITRKGRNGEEPPPFALFFIDLDNFKRVNDNAGHDAGDELLRNIAGYLSSSVSGGISFRPSAGMLNIAARIGGDEFIQIVEGVCTEEEAVAQAQRLLGGLASPNTSRYIEKYDVGLSIGIALFPYHTDHYHVLIKYADIAMYHAKREGKNTYCVYRDDMEMKAEK